ncbi:unnamed protein product, partial [Cuscuta epithymum]
MWLHTPPFFLGGSAIRRPLRLRTPPVIPDCSSSLLHVGSRPDLLFSDLQAHNKKEVQEHVWMGRLTWEIEIEEANMINCVLKRGKPKLINVIDKCNIVYYNNKTELY